jgi:LmbE family N-acetylglucosaminyl deacetylase
MRIILVLAPHTDDGELGCEGTIAKLINQGDRVVYIVW